MRRSIAVLASIGVTVAVLAGVSPAWGVTTVGTPITVGDGPSGVAFSPDGTTAYVTNQGDDTVSVLNFDPPLAVPEVVPALAKTGVDSLLPLLVGGALLAVGTLLGFMVLRSRRQVLRP